MKPPNRFWLMSICALACLLGAAHWFHTTPIYAQQSSNEQDDGIVYVYAYIDVDSTYNLYYQSYAEWDVDAGEDYDDFVMDEIQIDVDQSIDYDYFAPYAQYISTYPTVQFEPLTPGHEYGVSSIGWICVDYIEESGCNWQQETIPATASVNVASPAPQIAGLSTYSVHQGDIGTLTITGSNFIENSGDQLSINLAGSSAPFTLTSAPSVCTATCTASFSYDFTWYPAGTYTNGLSVTNNEGTSNGVTFTVLSSPPPPPPPDPCAVTSNPQAGYSSIVSTGTAGGSGTLAVSFSGAAFAAISPIVAYGPYSTPSSIAANIAALITKNYFQYGLSAKAFGPNIVYGGITTLGTVSNVVTGPSITTTTSTEAGTAAATACRQAPKVPTPNVEVTIVAWIDGNAITLPSGESIGLDAVFPPPLPLGLGGPWSVGTLGYALCLSEIASLTGGNLGVVSNTNPADKPYANAWLLKYSDNDDPGKIITPSTFTSLNFQYRLFADYSPGRGIHTTSIGYTPDPCRTPFVYLKGDTYPQNGHYTGDFNGTGTSLFGDQFLLAETRVGSAGQKGWKTLNNNREIPWVWSVIEFDPTGNPDYGRIQNYSSSIPTTNYQIFPTYSVYINGTRLLKIPAGTPAAFAAQPPGLSLPQGLIQ